MHTLGRRIGLLGGNGALSTAHLHQRFVALAHELGAVSDTDYPDFLVLNQPVAMDVRAFPSESWEKITDDLTTGAQRLAGAGADVIIILCNSLHVVYEALCQRVEVPIVNMVEVAARAIETVPVGLVSSQLTRELGLYQQYRQKDELIFADQQEINNCIGQVLRGEEDLAARELEKICQQLAGAGAQGILIGCTELSMCSARMERPDLPFIDSATEAFAASLGQTFIRGSKV